MPQVSIWIGKNGSLPEEVIGRLSFIGHDFQVDDENFDAFFPRVKKNNVNKPPEQWIGLPETESFRLFGWDETTKEQQEWYFDLIGFYAPSGMTLATRKKRWADLVDGDKFITNHHGPDDGYCDFINGVNMGKPGFGWQNTTTCGNVVLRWGGVRNFSGVPAQGVLVLDRTYPFPPIERIVAHPWFIHWATVCRYERGTQANFPRNAIAPNGTFRVDGFPHNDGNKVPVPIAAETGDQVSGDEIGPYFAGLHLRVNYINTRRLVALEADEGVPSAFVR